MTIRKLLETIATKRLGIPTLSARNSDSLDFRDCAVWQIRKALEDAYAAGFKAGREKQP